MGFIDFLYLSLALSVLAVSGSVVYLIIQIADTVKTAKMIVEDINDLTHDVFLIKNGAKVAILRFVKNLLNNRTGGDQNVKP